MVQYEVKSNCTMSWTCIYISTNKPTYSVLYILMHLSIYIGYMYYTCIYVVREYYSVSSSYSGASRTE